MPILTSVANSITKPLPKLLSPKAHAIADYLTIGAFAATAALFWKRNKRAALGALICGGAELVVNLLTDYPGGITDVISYRAHGKIDIGLAAMSATMPEFMAFPDDREKTFFIAQAVSITALTNLTDFEQRRSRSRLIDRRNSRVA
jgi:hypothetical protein